MSTEKLEFYRCEICGNLVQVVLSGAGELVCCNQPMKHLTPQHDKSELGEKHAPEYEFRDNKKFVGVYSHPMLPEHYIQFIEVQNKDKDEVRLKYFKPNSTAEFDISDTGDNIEAVEFCNIHGLWGENIYD